MARYDDKGREIPDQTKVPGQMFPRPLTLQEEMRRFIRTEMSREAADHGMESFEEADDFNVEDDDDLADTLTAHEMTLMHEEAPLPDASNLEGNNDDGRGSDAVASPVRDGAPALRQGGGAQHRASEDARPANDAKDPPDASKAERSGQDLRADRERGDRGDRRA